MTIKYRIWATGTPSHPEFSGSWARGASGEPMEFGSADEAETQAAALRRVTSNATWLVRKYGGLTMTRTNAARIARSEFTRVMRVAASSAGITYGYIRTDRVYPSAKRVVECLSYRDAIAKRRDAIDERIDELMGD